MKETCPKKYRELYEKGERERQGLEGRLQEITTDIQAAKQSLEKAHKQGYKLHQENEALKRGNEELGEEIRQLKGDFQGSAQERLRQLEQENHALKSALDDRDSAIGAMKRTLVEMKEAYIEAAKNICQTDDPVPETTAVPTRQSSSFPLQGLSSNMMPSINTP